ncbi:hypothetical protein [Coralloluteibacterium thermophilus]|uniref:Phage tail assembly chaperone n=1 Tax=Coralloluteibacterium thermophilum TaxID=2707049 RepID=A0ABV9NN97_9GAMM
MTDIATIVASERTIQIKHPATGAPLGLALTIRPDSHPEVKKARRAIFNERLKADAPASAEQLEEGQTSVMVAAVAAWEWSGDATYRGKKPRLDESTLREVLSTLPWVRDQLATELGNDAAFFPS